MCDIGNVFGRIQDSFMLTLCVWSAHTRWLFACSLSFPCWPVSASPTPTHITDLPTYLPQAPANDCSNIYTRTSPLHHDSLSKGHWGMCPLLVSLLMDEPTWWQFPLKLVTFPAPGSQDCSHVLPATCHTQWGVAPGPCFQHASPSSMKQLEG